jgi:NAD(P)-dependent dehydrogenase (short-subunit alcohol dehydrogenase family)
VTGRERKSIVVVSTSLVEQATRSHENQLNRLQGKVAVITGGSSGMGLATAEQFVTEGAYVYITGRREKELDAAVAKIGKNIAAVRGDVSNLEDLDRLYAKIAEDKGRVDIVFANAGVGNQMAPLGSITEEQIDRTFNVNVRGLIIYGSEGSSVDA